jgi:8-oxo-dGTP diphosphatase
MHSPEPLEVVGAVIVDVNGAILCALRGPGRALAGHWEFPGGKIAEGESAEEALVREIQEELGCTITVGDMVADHVHAYPAVEIRLRTYWSRLTTGMPVATEHVELRWVKPALLEALKWAPADVPSVEVLKINPILTHSEPPGNRHS